MSDFKGTPGPWQVGFSDGSGKDDGHIFISNLSDETVVNAREDEGYYYGVKNKYDAQLIAAAPELLKELENIANANPKEWDVEVRDQFQQWAQNRARAAIAKATKV